MVSCGPKRFDDPVARMTDRTAGLNVRWAAMRQAEREMPDSPRRLATLKQMIWQYGHATEFRTYAVDQLVAHDEADARNFLIRRLHLINDWLVYEYIAQLAIEQNWQDFTPAIVRRYAIEVDLYRDEDRPERSHLQQLNPGLPVEQIVTHVLTDTSDHVRIGQRVAAWQLLCRLMEKEQIISHLQALPKSNPLVADLQTAWEQLRVLPRQRETVIWMQLLRSDAPDSFWQQARRIVARLNTEQSAGLELRHLPTLIYAANNQSKRLKASHKDLFTDVSRILRERQRHLRGSDISSTIEPHPQTLHAAKQPLAWADLLSLRVLAEWMRQPTTVAALFAQADADFADTTTEHGGLLIANTQGTIIPTLYPPTLRQHDRAYIAPRKLIIDGHTALAHYHFHVHDHNNAVFAGPGSGDMKRIANTQRFSALVITSIDQNTLNIDYYHHGDVIVDLGVIHRPANLRP